MVEQLTYLSAWIIETFAACKIATLQDCKIARLQDCNVSAEWELIGNFDRWWESLTLCGNKCGKKCKIWENIKWGGIMGQRIDRCDKTSMEDLAAQ